MDDQDLRGRFQFHPADTPERRAGHAMVRAACEHLALDLNELLPEGREKSLAITNLEQTIGDTPMKARPAESLTLASAIPGRNSATLQGFFDQLGARRASIRAVSIDMSGEYQRAICQAIPHAEICFDPFHVCRLASRARTTCAATSGTSTSARTPQPAAGSRAPAGRYSRRPSARPSASSPPSAKSSRPTPGSTAPSCYAKSSGCSTNLDDPALAPTHLDAWLAWASRSRLRPFVALARTLRTHRQGILAAIRLGLSNGRLEGLNSKIRLISHRSYGFHSAGALIALVYLCCAGIVIDLPR